jgi:putative addiction module component (TIGR02574 family)
VLPQGATMNAKAKSLGDLARELSPQDRIALVEDVLDSLDRLDPNIDRLWATEASERLAAYRRGEIVAKDLSDIIAKYR